MSPPRLVLVTLALSLASSAAALAPCPLTPDLARLIEDTARTQGLPPLILTALVHRESAFCPRAVSHAGAIGLGQLMPGTARTLGVDPWHPAQNLQGAARYLRTQYDTFGRWDLALAAYNAGPGNVLKHRGVPPSPRPGPTW